VNDIFTSINAMPIVKSQPIYEGIPGFPVSFNAGDSIAPTGEKILNYDWDFTADGIYDRSTASSETKYTYDQPYTGKVRVRVTSETGKRSTAEFDVKVAPNTLIPANIPTGFIIDFDGLKPKLRWVIPNPSSVQTAQQSWLDKLLSKPAFAAEPDESIVYTIHAPDGALLRIVPPGESNIEIPDAIREQYDLLGIAAHTEQGSSDIIYAAIPDAPEETPTEQPTDSGPVSSINTVTIGATTSATGQSIVGDAFDYLANAVQTLTVGKSPQSADDATQGNRSVLATTKASAWLPWASLVIAPLAVIGLVRLWKYKDS